MLLVFLIEGWFFVCNKVERKKKGDYEINEACFLGWNLRYCQDEEFRFLRDVLTNRLYILLSNRICIGIFCRFLVLK